MLTLNRRRIPVVNEDNTAVGVVSVRDIIRALRDKDKENLIRPTVTQAVADAKARADQLASADSELGRQDLFRGLFVVAASAVGGAPAAPATTCAYVPRDGFD